MSNLVVKQISGIYWAGVVVCVLMGCSTKAVVESQPSVKKDPLTMRSEPKAEPSSVNPPASSTAVGEAIAAKPFVMAELRPLGDSLYEAGAFDEALPVWMKILEHAEDKQTSAASHYVIGTIFSHKTEYAKAELEFKSAIADDSTLIDSHRELGLVHFIKGEYDAALESFKKVLDYVPNDSEATYWIGYTTGSKAYEDGLSDFNYEFYDRAIEHFKVAAEYLEEDTSANYKIYFFLGKSYLEKLSYDKALQFLSQAVKLNPKMYEGYTEIGSIFFAQQEFAKAVQFNQKALSINPDFAKALNNLGYIYFTMGNNSAVRGEKAKADESYQKAMGLFEKALVVEPGMAGAKKNLEYVSKIVSGTRKVAAYTLLQAALKTENNADRIRQYRHIIAEDSLYDDAYVNLGVALYYEGKADSGIAAIRQAIAINPYNPQAQNNLGYILGTAHQYEEALTRLFTAIQIKRDYFDAYINLGYVYMWKEDFESSRKIWLQLLKLNPNNAMARKGFDEMERREKMVRAGETTTRIEISEDPAAGAGKK